MAGDKRVDYELSATDKTGAAFDSFKAKITGAERAFDGMMRTVASLAAVGGAAVVAFFGAASKAAEDARQATLRLNAVLRATGNVSGYTGDQLGQLADHLAEITQFDDEGFRTATAAILKFGDVSGKQLERVLKLSADFAALSGGDLLSAADTLGRAVAAPAQGIDRLQRSVGYLSEAEKNAVKSLEELGDHIGAQSALLDILDKKIGGTAEALNTGLTRATSGAGKAWNELLESIGGLVNNKVVIGVIDGIAESMRTLKAILDGDWTTRLIALLNYMAGGIPGKLGLVPDLGNQKTAAPTPGADDPARAALRAQKHNEAIAEQDERAIAGALARQKKLEEERKRLAKEAAEALFRQRVDYAEAELKSDQMFAEDYADAWRWADHYRNEEEKAAARERNILAKAESDANEMFADDYAEAWKYANAFILDEAKKREQELSKTWGAASDFAGQFFSDLVMNGRSAFDNLRKSLKQLLADMIALFAKRWILNLAAGGGLLGSAGAALAGGTGGESLAGGGLSLLSSGASALGGGGWLADTAIGETFTGALQAASGALMIFAAVIGGVIASAGLYSRGWGVNGETNIGDSAGRFSPESHISGTAFRIAQALGVNDKWASILSGQTLVARTFGHGAEHPDAFGIRGSVGSGGFSGENWQDMSRKGGWFRSDERWTDTSAFSSEQTAFFADLFKGVTATTSRLGDLLGVDSKGALAGYSRDFNLNFDENGKDPEEVAKLMQQRLGELLASVLKDQVSTVLQTGGKTGLAKFITDLTGAGDEIIATIDALVNALDILGESMSVEDLVAQASKTASTLFRDQGEALMTLASSTSLSTESLNALSAATLDYKSSAAQLIIGLESAKRQIDAMFGDTARNIKLAGMDEQGQYNFYQGESERLLELALKSNDAGEIERLSSLINQDISQAFGMLSPEQQISMQQEWLSRIEKANADIQTHLSEIQQEAAEEVNGNLKKIQDLLEKNATDQQAAANVQLQASQNQLTASKNPVRVTLDVNDTSAGAIVNEGG